VGMRGIENMPRVTEVRQESIRVEVRIASVEQRELLQRYPTWGEIEHLLQDPFEIPTSEFLAYYLYWKRETGMPAYQRFDQLLLHVEEAIAELNGMVDFDGTSIVRASGVLAQDRKISE